MSTDATARRSKTGLVLTARRVIQGRTSSVSTLEGGSCCSLCKLQNGIKLFTVASAQQLKPHDNLTWLTKFHRAWCSSYTSQFYHQESSNGGSAYLLLLCQRSVPTAKQVYDDINVARRALALGLGEDLKGALARGLRLRLRYTRTLSHRI